jgi:hypothetical protein
VGVIKVPHVGSDTLAFLPPSCLLQESFQARLARSPLPHPPLKPPSITCPQPHPQLYSICTVGAGHTPSGHSEEDLLASSDPELVLVLLSWGHTSCSLCLHLHMTWPLLLGRKLLLEKNFKIKFCQGAGLRICTATRSERGAKLGGTLRETGSQDAQQLRSTLDLPT